MPKDNLFHVSAGKYDGYEENCKFCASFESLDEALRVYEDVSDYPWYYIEYNGYTITAYRTDPSMRT